MGTVRINRPHGLVRLVTRTRRRTTIVEAAARINHLPGLIPHLPAVIHRRRGLTRHLQRHVPTQRPRALTPLLAIAMEVAEAEAAVVVVVAAAAILTAAVVVADRMAAAALTEAVLTDAKISGKKPAPIWSGLFFV